MKQGSALPVAPTEYSQEYMNRLLRQIQIVFNAVSNPGPLTAASDLTQTNQAHPISALTLINLPTSSANLPSGSIYNDAGTLKIVS